MNAIHRIRGIKRSHHIDLSKVVSLAKGKAADNLILEDWINYKKL